jgi:hypothetical protein
VKRLEEIAMIRMLLVAIVSFVLFMLGGMGVWHVFYEPTAPKDLHQYEEQMRRFDMWVVVIWLVFLIAIWQARSWFRKS